MKKDIAEKWVKALRSGDYKQGRKRLKMGDSYCCLGVLSDLSGLGDWSGSRYKIGEDTTGGYLSEEVMSWSGVKNAWGRVGMEVKDLITLNDQGSTFEEIADIIEKYQEEL